MGRNDWVVEQTGAKLLEGAKRQLEFRQGRLKFWESQKEQIMTAVKEKGLTVKEDIEEGSYKLSSMAMRGGARILVDGTMQQDLNQCMDRIGRNARLVKEYEGWIAMLAAAPEKQFEVDFEDWNYFFGK